MVLHGVKEDPSPPQHGWFVSLYVSLAINFSSGASYFFLPGLGKTRQPGPVLILKLNRFLGQPPTFDCPA